MGAAADLVNAGYIGYQGWGDAEAAADFRATGGSGKRPNNGGGGGGGGGSSWKPISAVDFAKLEEQAFEMLKPYYLKIAQESRGDFSRAIQILDEDYKRGVRIAKEDTSRGVKNVEDELSAELERFGLTFPQEQEATAENLNKRGMAVYQNSPDGTPNVLNMGRGGFELGNLKKDQALRKEAVERSANRQITELTSNLSKVTNPAAEGKTPEQIAAMDRSQLGSAELGLVRGKEQTTREQQLKEQDLFEKRRAEAQNIAQMFAGTEDKKISQDLAKRYQTNAVTDFVERGV